MVAGGGRTIDFMGVDEFAIKEFTPRENEIFEAEWPKLTQLYTKYSTVGNRHAIQEVFNDFKEEIRFFGQLCKQEIDPSPGAFEGMQPRSGFGWSTIRPGYLTPTEQGSGDAATFQTAVSGLTANNWYGIYHHAAIGGAYNASPLYLRKELGAIIIGQLEMNTPIIEEMQWEIEGVAKPIMNMMLQMRGSDLQMFEYPKAVMLRPSKQYRSKGKFSAEGGSICPVPLGVSFVDSAYMKLTGPTQPDSTAP